MIKAGTISHAQAIEKATEEYRKYQAQNLSPVEEEYLESIRNIHSVVKKKRITDRKIFKKLSGYTEGISSGMKNSDTYKDR